MISKELASITYPMGMVSLAVASPQVPGMAYMLAVTPAGMTVSAGHQGELGETISGDFETCMRAIHTCEMAIWSSKEADNALEAAWKPAVAAMKARKETRDEEAR